MAITQTRMLALIHAGETFRDQILSSNKFVRTLIQSLPPNATQAQTLQTLQDIQQYFAMMSISPEALNTLATEKAHFRANARRNERHAAHARRKRGASDTFTSARSTAPDTISPSVPPDLHKYFNIKPDLEPQVVHKPTGIVAMQQWNEADVLIDQKIKINKIHADMNMKEPYNSDAIFDESIPLDPDHYQFLGLERPESDDSIF
jgi:hypothetical protein